MKIWKELKKEMKHTLPSVECLCKDDKGEMLYGYLYYDAEFDRFECNDEHQVLLRPTHFITKYILFELDSIAGYDLMDM